MSRIFVTGDKHGNYDQLKEQLTQLGTNKDDVVIVLGDHGTLYYGGNDDRWKKKVVSRLPATFIMIRGNHDRRASSSEYNHQLVHFNQPAFAGSFYVDPNFPNTLYTSEFGWYRFGNKHVFVINGAYSVDGPRRKELQLQGFKNYHWFTDEQLNEAERSQAATELLHNAPQSEIFIMSHTCPIKYKPWDKLLSFIDQSTVDETMEKWLDTLDNVVPYQKWYCGHWHIERTVDNLRFMYNDIELFDEVKEKQDESGDQETT